MHGPNYSTNHTALPHLLLYISYYSVRIPQLTYSVVVHTNRENRLQLVSFSLFDHRPSPLFISQPESKIVSRQTPKDAHLRPENKRLGQKYENKTLALAFAGTVKCHGTTTSAYRIEIVRSEEQNKCEQRIPQSILKVE